MISNKTGLQYIAELFIQAGIEHIVISPGSRNAPMMLTFPEYKEFKCYSIIDERSAAFFALGIALKTRKPVVLNCTSGSALLNYAPAIAEAYYQNIPLIILSADRPEELIDHGDGQAINQIDVFRNFIKKSISLPGNLDGNSSMIEYQELINGAIQSSLFPLSGPVHINVPLSEPIYGTETKKNIELLPLPFYTKKQDLGLLEKSELKKVWSQSTKKLIIIGQNPIDKKLHDSLVKLAEREDVVIMTETTSNQNNPSFISNIDRVLSQKNEINEKDLFPDLVISFGGHLVSKKIKSWLRKGKGYKYWQVSLSEKQTDTFFRLSNHIQLPDNLFIEYILKLPETTNSSFKNEWNSIDKKAQKLHRKYLKTIPFSDLYVFDCINKNLPKKRINLHFANSTPIRYSQLFNFNDKMIIDGNRGVSGIDGSVSTALGASLTNKELTCLISGDLSFFYDSNALWNNYLHPNFRIIIINNGGGGIFRFIDGPMQSEHLNYFETPHNRKAASLAKEAGMEYLCCGSEDALANNLKSFFAPSKHSKLLEVFTPREINDKILKEYFSFLRS